MKNISIIVLPLLLFAAVITKAQPLTLTRKIKAETVGQVAASLKANYVFLDTAIKMGNFIQRQLKSGSYDTIKTPAVFAKTLTADLLSVYHDGHLSISYNPTTVTVEGKPDTAAVNLRRARFRKNVNFGLDKAEILPGNIGYIKIRGFFEPDSAAKLMETAAFRFVSNSDYLIIDLRENMGGSPDMVSYICGFLFDKKTHLNDLYSRRDNWTNAFWAIPNAELKSLYTVPVYILTSSRTFSAGEELSYDLQTQKRAVIIGETTGGGAHPVQPFAFSNGFTVNVPIARAINAVTHTNWESVGVKPDKIVPADQALDVAIAMTGKR